MPTIRGLFPLLAAAMLLCSGAASTQSKPVLRPNIVIFLVDDMGWQDCSVPFLKERTPLNDRYRTPAMERLAASGVKMTSAYTSPVCTPSRVSMITGMNVTRHHVVNWTSPFRDRNTDNPDRQLQPVTWNQNGLSPVAGVPGTIHATPLPWLLNRAGYYTIHVGKAHWGSSGTPGSSPLALGFQVNIAGQSTGHPQSYLGEDNYGNVQPKWSINAVSDMQEYHGSGTFLTEALTREALRALDAPIRNGQPFFLHLSHYAVHTPIMADRRYLQRYLDQGLDSTEAAYATLVEGMDKSLGDLLDFLRDRKVEDNTLIIFLSDNGGLSLAPPRGGKPFTHNLPLRAGKGSVYEGGIRDPVLIRWPGVTKPGTAIDVPVHVDDLFPTLLDAARITDARPLQTVDGQSLVPLLAGRRRDLGERTFYWHYPVKWIDNDGPGINFHSALRRGDWKLVVSLRTGKKELYNMRDDIREEKDLSAARPELVRELSTLLGRRLREMGSPMPRIRETGAVVSYPDEN
ncbi:MAG: sulfatase [Chitinophagia bacterium]|nr:sulfatase [Chitinophagia bacterium]